MEKKKKKENVKTYLLLTGLVILCITACIWTYYKSNDSAPKVEKASTKEELIAKTEELVTSKSWLSGADSTEEFVYVLTLRDLKEKYRVDVTDFEEKAKCDLDQTYVEVNAKAGKATYDAFLTCKNITEKE